MYNTIWKLKFAPSTKIQWILSAKVRQIDGYTEFKKEIAENQLQSRSLPPDSGHKHKEGCAEDLDLQRNGHGEVPHYLSPSEVSSLASVPGH